MKVEVLLSCSQEQGISVNLRYMNASHIRTSYVFWDLFKYYLPMYP